MPRFIQLYSRRMIVGLVCFLALLAFSQNSASQNGGPIIQISDEKHAVLQWGCASREQPRLELRLNRALEIRIYDSTNLHDPTTHDLPLNTAIDVVSGKNGQVLLHEGDVNDTAPSARIVSHKLEGGKVWGEYDVSLKDARWKGSFIAKRHKNDPCARGAMTSLASLFSTVSEATQKTISHDNAKPLRVVSVRFGEYAGFCTGYCSWELQETGGKAILVKRSRGGKSNASIRDKHWEELVQLVDRQAIFALPDNTSCGTCTDGVDEFVEVKFSDHTHKQVTWAAGSPPKQLKALRDKLRALEDKLDKEFPNSPE